jgi:hypothetical protein
MWIEIEVMLSGNTIDWKSLGLEVQHEWSRRMVRAGDIQYVQELMHDIQIMAFYDNTTCLIKGNYKEIRSEILHLDQETDLD